MALNCRKDLPRVTLQNNRCLRGTQRSVRVVLHSSLSTGVFGDGGWRSGGVPVADVAGAVFVERTARPSSDAVDVLVAL